MRVIMLELGGSSVDLITYFFFFIFCYYCYVVTTGFHNVRTTVEG